MESTESGAPEEHETTSPVRSVCVNGLSMETADVEAKLDAGTLEEAENSVREGLSLSHEEARALLGRLEYERENFEGVLRALEGVDLQSGIENLQPSIEKPPSRKSKSRGPSDQQAQQPISHHPANLLLEGIHLKSMSLQKLGRITEAADECKTILDAVDKIFPNGVPEVMVDAKLQETIIQAVELLPELWKQADCYSETMAAYRSALLGQWNLDIESCARIQKRFAVFLLYGGIEAGPPSLAVQIEGSYVPKNNLEEAMLLLMIVLRKFYLRKIDWDPSVMQHFTFALSLCGQTSVLARQFEEVPPGNYPRCDRWYLLALCYSGAGQNNVALNLLRKSLNRHERPDDPLALLLAAKICSEECVLASEGVGYARRAVANCRGVDEHLKGVGLRLLGVCLGKQAKVASSDLERTVLQSEALKSLEEAVSRERQNPDLMFELGVEHAEHHNSNAALRFAKKFINATGGSVLKGWRLLALVLSAQQRYSEAEVVVDAALDETAKWERGPLIRLKAKLKIAQSLHMDAVETYRFLLALVQAQRKSFGSFRSNSQAEEDDEWEFEVWHGLASLYSSLKHWQDAEICLEKAKALKQYSADMLYTEGVMYEARGQIQEGLAAYSEALSLELDHVPCMVSIGVLLWKAGSKLLPAARTFLSDALRHEPMNRSAWYYLGLVHRDDGRIADASDCFQAASMLEESDPVESYSSIL
ncbi:protein NPG1-like [Magnolia sinica]|uniref:protein NPG1-like n=1 Tax=Magnolia sinica TaxID=86752 RepID=UPI002658FC36|nr:protein NPG1-like [Magnolia sinica]